MNKTKVNECVFKWCLNVWEKQGDLEETFGVAKEIVTMIMDFYGSHFKCANCSKWRWGRSTIKCTWYNECGAVFCENCQEKVKCKKEECVNLICSVCDHGMYPYLDICPMCIKEELEYN